MSQTEDAENLEKTESTTKNGKEDEQLIGGMVFEETVIEPSEFCDPAILAVKDGPKYRYTKDELIGLKEVPLSKKKPDFINAECVPPSIWSDSRKKSATPTDAPKVDGGGVSLQPDGRRGGGGRAADPRERIRKENDGIVLSPQRRSFNTGCFVPVREQPATAAGNGRPRAHSPMGGGGKGDGSHAGPRDVQSSVNRRIGSGRILRDTWDFNDKEGGDNEYYRNQDERRNFRRDYEVSRDKDKQRNSMGRYGSRRISGGDKDEEPEWFSGGPLSQNDTIELRGFEDGERGVGNGKKKPQPSSSQAKRVREWAKKKGGSISEEKAEEENHAENGQKQGQAGAKAAEPEQKSATDGGTVDNAEKSQDKEQQNDNDKENRQNPPAGGMEINENSFIFDDIFKCDTIPGLLSNGVEGAPENNTKSKFSRWFKRESPDKASTAESRRSSLHEEHILKNLLNDINDPGAAGANNVNVSIPQLGSSESYFAPISPAAVNAVAGEPGAPKPAAGGHVNIADMFLRGGKAYGAGGGAKAQHGDVLNNIKTQFPGKVLSLNELESNMRKGLDISSNQNQNKHNMIKKEEEIAAFKKLLAQVSGGQVFPSNGANHQKVPAMSIMEMLTHSQQQDEAQARLNAQKSLLMGPASPKAPPTMNPLHSEFLLKMQQAQQEQQAQLQRQQQANMLNKLMGLHAAAAPHLRSSPLQELAQQQSKELLNRPEAQAILQGMKRGDITPQHIYQQLANPALQPRHREMLSAILRFQRLGPSPRVLSPVPPPVPHHMFPQQQQQQQLRVSPLPNAFCVSPIMANSPNTLTVPAMHQRIPSPRELQVHTQSILQRALIKKRLEEQQVNFRKKQEMQQMPNNGSSNKNVSSPPTPLAFTPTSVLRKMTADKEDGNKESKNVEANKFQQGRAVIGARMQQQPQQPNNQWNSQYHSKQPGRPIVKANAGYHNAATEQFFNVHQQQQFVFNQQQQSLKQQQAAAGQQQTGGQFGQHQKSSQSNSGVSSLGYIGQYSNQSNQQTQQFPQLTQQQLRAQHQQSLPLSTNTQPTQQQQTTQQQNSQGFSQQQPQQQSTAWQQFLNAAAAQQSGRNSGSARKEDDGSGATTTSTSNSGGSAPSSASSAAANQLSRWFSSDLLERARVGELPSTAGLAEHAVSLEEVERQAAPPVHN